MTSTPDFTIGRNNPLENADRAGLNLLLGSVADAFGVDWLTTPSGVNRIQRLWSRQDGLATNQLAILGDAIQRLLPLNADWIARRVQAVKSELANRKGDLFELLGLSLFALAGQNVTGAGEDNPGYDGAIDFGRGVLASVSLKDFGVSSHQNVFENQAASIERAMVAGLHEGGLNGLGLRVEASRYPLQSDWDRLRRAIAQIISDCRRNCRPYQAGAIWTLTPQPLSVDQGQLANGRLSYTLTVVAPHHANEQRNIETKIEDACVNLSKHARKLAADIGRFLLVRIPDTTSATACVACTQEWLRDRPDAAVDAVILYQPAVAASSIGAPAGIVHLIALVTGPGFERWRHSRGRLELAIQARVMVGTCTNKPTKLLGVDGTALGDCYIYQRGDVYALCQVRRDGTIVGNMANPAPGIMIHSVARIPGQRGEFVVSGKFPPDSKMLLYS